MNTKTIMTTLLLAFVCVTVGYLVLGETRTSDPTPTPNTEAQLQPPSSATDAVQPKVIAYYFHSTQRCHTCLKIERLAEEALRAEFADALAGGELEWRKLNMEEAPNAHFVDDYELVTSSLVIVDFQDGEQRAWSNMAQVWEFVHDDESAFRKYVTNQVRAYLES